MLTNCHILVVEDEALIALELVSILEDEHADIVGRAETVAAAQELLAKRQMNCALLDISLRGQNSFAIADALSDMRVPFAFVTGYADSVVPDRHRDRPFIKKPFVVIDVIRTVAALVAERTGRTNRR